jgi:hypothetical protein
VYYNNARMTVLWGLIAASALLWPDHLRGPFDGVPLDGTSEAIFVGAIFPILWALHARFLRTLLARTCIVALFVFRIATSLLLPQEGWCLQWQPARPFAKDAAGAPHAWDLRADWRGDRPACSAIVTRSYDDIQKFPAWFFNLPPDNDSWPSPQDRPPGATVVMHVHGYLEAPHAGVLRIDTGPDMRATMAVDGQSVEAESRVAEGVHTISIDATMTGDRWQLMPRWNGTDLWSATVGATVRRPTGASVRLHRWLAWVPPLLVVVLLASWTASLVVRVGDAGVIAWTIAASVAIGWLVANDHEAVARWAIVALTGAAFVPVLPRLRNLFGAAIMIGIPWITYVVVASTPAIGRWNLYGVGNDFWMYQRFAYRIVMQGYWLEGGSPTFWFQAGYRWIVSLLHVVFGDSSVGEWYWDGACLLAGALFSFRIARTFAGFRWGLVAAVAPLGVFVLGTAQKLIGMGLGEISSSGLLSVAALCAIASRRRGVAVATVAGVLALFAFYTRLNNLPMAIGVALFALPLRLPMWTIPHPRVWWRQLSLATVVTILLAIAAGLLAFAWRTWHYTGMFSIFYGTQKDLLSLWRPGMTASQIASGIAGSVMMVLTVNDPPRFDVYALPVMAGALVAVLSLAMAPRFRNVPAAATLFFFTGIAGAFVARGGAYEGRFSVHVMPITCALMVCGIASLGRHRQIEWKAP